MRWMLLCLPLVCVACDSDDPADQPTPSADAAVGAPDGAEPEPDAAPDDPDRATLAHSFGTYNLEPFEEVQPCVIWTLNNDEPLYVNRVSLGNDGSYHHSNWFVVPEDLYAGPDGYFRCGERDFEELKSAVAGTVLFAQSTQSIIEHQQFGPGAVVKIPPRHSVVTSAHMLNLSDRAIETDLRMELELIHPKDVTAVLSAFRLTYTDLAIPAGGEARFTGECDFTTALGGGGMKLHWVLPHYHYLGNHFRLELMGGANDGMEIYGLDGFNADANGRGFDPPLQFGDATGVRFTCGYRNPTESEVGWGIGDQEMCVMLGLMEANTLVDATVGETSDVVMEGGIEMHSGGCNVIGVPKNGAQAAPTDDEKAGELYVPETAPSDVDVAPAPDCVDTPEDATFEGDAKLSAVRSGVLLPRCSFSSCHGNGGSAGGLDLAAVDLHAALLGHEMQRTTELPLVKPGDPGGSYLFQVLSTCAADGPPHMPLNAPQLMPPDLVAMVRDWIAAGANDD